MTKFMVDGQEKTLELRDSNGIDWSADFIGNTAHGMENDEDGRYIATQEDYDWWVDAARQEEEASALEDKYAEKYGREAVDEIISMTSARSADMDNCLNSVKLALANLDE